MSGFSDEPELDREWPAGLHEIHCREDRCCLGCDCPCHRGEPVPPFPVSMSAIEEARGRLAEAEVACLAAERQIWLPPWIFRRRVNAAMKEWQAANIALFDAQMAHFGLGPPPER